jgi:SAM-dependent methyltransferase
MVVRAKRIPPKGPSLRLRRVQALPDDLIRHFYPETAVGGYSSVDGTVEFYGRINALLHADMRILDFGAGRGAWYESEQSPYRRSLRDFGSKVAELVGCDIDRAILDNPAVDERVVISPDSQLPFDNEEFDLIVADYVFEHLENPTSTAAELGRILKPGGWICARTPNRNAYISLLTRLIPNRLHTAVLNRAQPNRETRDVFPSRFRLNTPKDIAAAFSDHGFDHCIYYYEAEPGYNFGSPLVYRIMLMLNSNLPRRLRANLFIFLRKRQPTPGA